MHKKGILLFVLLLLCSCGSKTILLPTQTSKPSAVVSENPDIESFITIKSSPDIMVNQVGYLPNFSKIASYRSTSIHPIEWVLVSNKGENQKIGRTVTQGLDEASADHLHLIDFSDFKKIGDDYRIKIAGQYSRPFRIDYDIYSAMKLDGIRFFYHQRSNIDITMPYAQDENLVRPAGHHQDKKVPCLPLNSPVFKEGEIPVKFACNREIDVSGGWYDAGDHGKYVVNGGSAVWTLLNLYERALYLGSNKKDFKDGTLNIPESKNGVPDILDEVRWELEFFLKMQVPKDEKYSGMLHHKIHSESWTPIPTPPHNDDMPRLLYPVSTTATLNGAASFAMAARLYEKYDSDFAAKCLLAAQAAWKAALKYPDAFASSNSSRGGGPYDDPRIEDEKYWAAAELFITTGKDEYKKVLEASPFFKVVPSFLEYDQTDGVFTWKDVAPLGNLSLAVVPNELEEEVIKEIRENILKAAAEFDEKANSSGLMVPLTIHPKGTWPWGSNSNIINNLIIFSLAYDFTKDKDWIDAALTGMSYILGRNPMDTSYVTGHGSNPIQNPHHRFFAHQKDPNYPKPPPGVFAGGPNSGIQDDYAQKHLKGCPPAKCFIDHIDSWSTNEIAINWNASFAWVAAFLDEMARKYKD